MRNGFHHVPYRPMPAQLRFGLLGQLLHSERCYTDKELQFRLKVLVIRQNSKLDPELLQTDDSWFNENDDTALLNPNESSWVLGNEFQPRHELSAEEFHIPLLNHQRMHWPKLSEMMRMIGDYLLIRNKELASDYLNQPMNYILLDMIQILKRLAIAENGPYVMEQVKYLHHYLRSVETLVSYQTGSDRLFLADCRRFIELNIQETIEHKLQSQLLKKDMEQVQRQLSNVAQLRHAALHFSLTANEINSHPYIEYFAQSNEKSIIHGFPTTAAKACAKQASTSSPSRIPSLELSADLLKDCQDFKFIDNLSEEIKATYAKSIVDLQEILRFQQILEQLLQLFDQAGEVFTLIQFREQMLHLLQSIEQFIHHSHHSLIEILDANTQAYHQHIQEQQDTNWWKKWNQQLKTSHFIANQDNLARFATNPADLNSSCKELLQQINQVILHLTQYNNENKQLELISTTRDQVTQLMSSMHNWVSFQHQIQGLPEPEKLALPEEPDAMQEIEVLQRDEMPVQQQSFIQFWPTVTNTRPNPQLLQLQNTTPSAINQSLSDHPMMLNNNSLVILAGFLLLLPIGLLVCKCLYDYYFQRDELPKQPCNPDKSRQQEEKIADLFTQAYAIAPDHDFWKDKIDYYHEDFIQLQQITVKSQKDFRDLQELQQDIIHLLESMREDIDDEKSLRQTP